MPSFEYAKNSLLVVLVLAIVVGELEIPGLGQLERVLGERGGVARIPVRPVDRGRGAAAEFGLRAVAVSEHQRAPHVSIGIRFLIGITQRQRGAIAQLTVDDAINRTCDRC